MNTVPANIIVDARSEFSFLKIYSITLLERTLRQLNEIGVHEVSVITSPDNASIQYLRSDFRPRFTIKITTSATIDVVQFINERLVENDCIILEGNGIYDDRILNRLIYSDRPIGLYHTGKSFPIAFRLSVNEIKQLKDLNNLNDLPINMLSVLEMDRYNSDLRQEIIPIFIKVENPSELKKIEDELYEKTFKGAMDFIATYIYKKPVRELVRFLAPTPISPNIITAISITCSILSVPLFATGWIWTGLIAGFVFIICDSLDGKLARLTIRLSKIAGHLDRKTSTPAVSLWSLALGWWFAKNIHDISFLAGVSLFILTLLDKWTRMAFKSVLGRSILDYNHTDTLFHLIASRRTINLFCWSVGALMSVWAPISMLYSFYFTVIWMALTWLWHLIRFGTHYYSKSLQIKRSL